MIWRSLITLMHVSNSAIVSAHSCKELLKVWLNLESFNISPSAVCCWSDCCCFQSWSIVSHGCWKLEKMRERFSFSVFFVPRPLSPPKLLLMSLLIFHCILTSPSLCLKAAGIVCPFSQNFSFLHPSYQELIRSLLWHLELFLFLGPGCVCDLLTHSSSQALWSSD